MLKLTGEKIWTNLTKGLKVPLVQKVYTALYALRNEP